MNAALQDRHPSVTTQIASGTRTGPYEIISRIGAGGMGVLRARDRQIGRDVATKVLPVSVPENADRLHRFELEARAPGTLNHSDPNGLTEAPIGVCVKCARGSS